MNHNLIIRATNQVALYATAALIYWVFIFLTITVFDLKVFRERMTETFFLSVLGIFAILGGAIVLNVMSNLSKISAAVAERNGEGREYKKPGNRGFFVIAGLLSFPIIAGLLFGGNYLSAKWKRDLLIRSAEGLISDNQELLKTFSDYTFSREYLKKSSGALEIIGKIDKNFPKVVLLTPDLIEGKKVFLAFSESDYSVDKEEPQKRAYIFSTSRGEREYLEKIFATEGDMSYKFDADKGRYQLFYPVSISGKKFVLCFSDYQRYGKIGS